MRAQRMAVLRPGPFVKRRGYSGGVRDAGSMERAFAILRIVRGCTSVALAFSMRPIVFRSRPARSASSPFERNARSLAPRTFSPSIFTTASILDLPFVYGEYLAYFLAYQDK